MRTLPAAALAAALILQPLLPAQQSTSEPIFDVASIKLNKANDRPYANFPLGPGDVYVPNGGLFSARALPLMTYITFAYKMNPSQAESLRTSLPVWVAADRYDIQARADGNPSKDQMRLMMRSLLASRFKLMIHPETRQMAVYALVPVKPGTTGPHLQPHPADSPCSTLPNATEAPTPPPGLPAVCGGTRRMPPTAPGLVRWAARNVTIGLLAAALTNLGGLDRPVLDRTELSGTYDFSLEWAPEFDNGPGFQEALKQQLGLKLLSQKSPVDLLIADHIERPSDN